MKYTTRISRRQVLLAFDLYIKRLQILAGRNPGLWTTLKNYGHKPLDKPTALPAKLNLKSIASTCRISTGTLNGLIEGEFRICKWNRAKVAKWAKEMYRP